MPAAVKTANVAIEDKLRPLCDYLEKAIKTELEKQGHIATGKLRESIKVTLKRNVDGFTLEGKGSNIAKYVDWGRKAGGKRVPINALIAWIKVKGLASSGKSEVSLAWAIQYAIWKNGIPTNPALKDAKTQFVTRTLKGAKDRIKSDVRNASYYFYGIEIDNIIREVKEKYHAR